MTDSIENFKKTCKILEDLKLINENKWQDIKNSQELLGENYEPIIDIYAYLYFRHPKCPNCGLRLIKDYLHNKHNKKYILNCVCGYNFAKESAESLQSQNY